MLVHLKKNMFPNVFIVFYGFGKIIFWIHGNFRCQRQVGGTQDVRFVLWFGTVTEAVKVHQPMSKHLNLFLMSGFANVLTKYPGKAILDHALTLSVMRFYMSETSVFPLILNSYA